MPEKTQTILDFKSFSWLSLGRYVLNFVETIFLKEMVLIGKKKPFEPRHEKNLFSGFRPGKTQSGLLSNWS